jgi:hypothetical protein
MSSVSGVSTAAASSYPVAQTAAPKPAAPAPAPKPAPASSGGDSDGDNDGSRGLDVTG